MSVCLICGKGQNDLKRECVCPSCLTKIRLADAVLAMPEGSELIKRRRADIMPSDWKPWAFESWADPETEEDGNHGSGSTPLEALEAAGVKS